MVAVAISIVALMIADKSPKKPEIKLCVWVNNVKSKNNLKKVIFQIENLSKKEPIKGLIVSFKFPELAYDKNNKSA